MTSARASTAQRGFTLIEMLLVVLIMGTLATILLPNYRQATYRAKAADVITRIEAINVSLKAYEDDHGVPPAGAGPVGTPPTWLAPYVEPAWFSGAEGLSLQLVIASATEPAQLLANAGGNLGVRQILLAAAGLLGDRAVVMGGGSQVAVTLTH